MKREHKTTGFQGSRFLFMRRGGQDRIISPARLQRGCAILFLVLVCAFLPGQKACAAPIRVVIDPGHGGSEFGSKYGSYTEKYMNMVVAEAMAEELKKFDDVEVFLTRTGDTDMSLQERADYAHSVGADFLFCLHFNASEDHNLYGAEVWCSAFGEYYSKGRCFGEMCLDELCSLGVYRRGVKMKLSEQEEDADYYGILRHCVEYGIPACIIEHCYLDNQEDNEYYRTTESMEKLGKLDAAAAAKYYALSSKELDVSYKDYPRIDIGDLPKMDVTEPEASLTCLRIKKEEGEADVLLTGKDEESGLLYYAFSFDGGETYERLQKWEEETGELELFVEIPKDRDVDLCCRVYNGYDLYQDTESIHIPAIEPADEPDKNADGAEGAPAGSGLLADGAESAEAMARDAASGNNVYEIDMSRYEKEGAGGGILSELKQADLSGFFLLLALGFLAAMLFVLLLTRWMLSRKRKKTRHRGKRR